MLAVHQTAFRLQGDISEFEDESASSQNNGSCTFRIMEVEHNNISYCLIALLHVKYMELNTMIVWNPNTRKNYFNSICI